ncbi:MAG: sugar ABC transporter substrate-binding protein [Clostridiaceae bacterium]|nr:sugar ABC transporter substrate-binding protein [Clostridiaceae bacterium]
MKKRMTILLALALVLSVLIVGCAKKDDARSNLKNEDKAKVEESLEQVADTKDDTAKEDVATEKTKADESEVTDAEPAEETEPAVDSESSDKKKVAIVLPVDHLALNEARDAMIEVISREFGEDNVEFDIKNANGDDSLLNSIFSEVVGSNPDIILPIATGPSQIAVTTVKGKIPIVFSCVTDPVEAGLTPSWQESGDNVTGVSDMADIESIIDFALQLYPETQTVGIVYNSAEVNSQVQAELCKGVLKEKGLDYKEGTITNTSELQQVVENLAVDVDIFYSPTDNDVASAMPAFQQVANKHNLPIFPGASSMVESGGTGTVGLSYRDLGLQAGEMVVRILKGESVADNPPETVEKVTMILNQDQVEELGIVVPAELEGEVEYVTTIE